MTPIYYVIFITCIVICSDGARILCVFPVPSISHQVVFRPLTQELARRGHEVVVITPNPAFPAETAPTNLTEIDLHDLSYEVWKETAHLRTIGSKEDLVTQTMIVVDVFISVLEKQILSNEVQSVIKSNTTFDLILLESCVSSTLSFSSLYKVPVIQVSSLGAVLDNFDTVGVPTHPIIYPTFINQRLYNLTLWEKILIIHKNFKYNNLIKYHEYAGNEMIKKVFGFESPSVAELKNNINLLYLNVHPFWEGNFPVPPAVVYMGGIHEKPVEKMTEDLKRYLDSSKHGVIYISFGTNTIPSNLSPDTIQMFIKVFSQLPYDVLWKWDKDELPGQTHNIRIGKWFPQVDLLKHPKILLFITQGGLQSTDEAIAAGIPLIGIPMRMDQYINVEKYEFHRIGVRFNIESITEEQLRSAIHDIITKTSYREQIVRLRRILRDQPQLPLQRAVWWVEHVLRHSGASHLRSPAANISAAEYLQLDLVLLLFATVCLLFIPLFCICKTAFSRLFDDSHTAPHDAA